MRPDRRSDVGLSIDDVIEPDIARAIDRSRVRPEPDDVLGNGCAPATSDVNDFPWAPERALDAATGRSGTGTNHPSSGAPGGAMVL
jgi:hypothetical protein